MSAPATSPHLASGADGQWTPETVKAIIALAGRRYTVIDHGTTYPAISWDDTSAAHALSYCAYYEETEDRWRYVVELVEHPHASDSGQRRRRLHSRNPDTVESSFVAVAEFLNAVPRLAEGLWLEPLEGCLRESCRQCGRTRDRS